MFQGNAGVTLSGGPEEGVARFPMMQISSPAAVFQPRPGLGDLIWHLPHIRAIAQSTDTGKVTLIVKPSTQAREMLADDPAIERIVWYEHNPRQGRGRHDGLAGHMLFIRDVRACRLSSCVLLHHSASLGAVMRLAGIPNRYGYGDNAWQRFWLNRPPTLPRMAPFTEAFDQATAYMAQAGLVDLPEPSLRLPAQAGATLASRLPSMEKPLAVLGVGAHGDNRQWGAPAFAELALALHRLGFRTILLLAALHEAAHVDEIRHRAGVSQVQGVKAGLGWPLPAVMAVLAEADLFVGNDSGLMNLRAALGRPAYGLFGASGPLRHSRLIRPIVPPGGARAGMSQISLRQVLGTIADDEPLKTPG